MDRTARRANFNDKRLAKIRDRQIMDIFNTITSLFSGERVSHTDTFILAAVAIGLYIGVKKLRSRVKKDD